MNHANDAPSDRSTTSLLRGLGPYMAISVVVGNVIGSGIFVKPGNIAASCGNFPVILLVWCLGGVLCVLGALCFAELATMLPRAGGIYVYLYHAYGKLPAFLMGWMDLLFLRPASIGALAVIFVGSLSIAVQWDITSSTKILLSSLLILGMAGINIAGVVWGGRVQLATTAVKGVFLLLVGLSPFLAAPFLGNSFHLANYASTVTPMQTSLPAQIATVLLAVMWAYNGWHGVTPLAEEIRDPQRNIPIALFGGVAILIFLYVLANLAYHGVLSMQEMQAAGDHAAEAMLLRLAGPAGQAAMSIVIMCSTFGAINTNLLQAPRITFAMGRDRVFFRSLGHIHPTFRTPVVAIMTTSIMGILLLVLVSVGQHWVTGWDATQISGELPRRVIQSLQDNSIFDLLTNFVIFSASVFYMMAVASLIILRKRHPEWERPYRTWGYPWVPITFLATYTWFLSEVYASSPLESRTGVGLILAGIPVYFLFQQIEKRRNRMSLSPHSPTTS